MYNRIYLTCLLVTYLLCDLHTAWTAYCVTYALHDLPFVWPTHCVTYILHDLLLSLNIKVLYERLSTYIKTNPSWPHWPFHDKFSWWIGLLVTCIPDEVNIIGARLLSQLYSQQCELVPSHGLRWLWYCKNIFSPTSSILHYSLTCINVAWK